MKIRLRFCVVSTLLCLGLFAFAGCGQHERTPTSPEPLTSATAAERAGASNASLPSHDAPAAALPQATAEASHGRGGGNHGHGGGNPGGNHGGGTPEAIHLSLEIQPDAWNTNYVHSHGTVTARIDGSGLDKIDLGSLVLVGTDAAAAPLAPRRVQRVGHHVQAFFGKADAWKTLDHPQPGDQVKVTIRLTVDGTSMDLTDTIRIVGPAHT